MSVYYTDIWSILRLLVYCMDILYILWYLVYFSRFGMLHQEKSCDPGVKHRFHKQQQTVRFCTNPDRKVPNSNTWPIFAVCVNDSLVVYIVYDFWTRWAGSQINKQKWGLTWPGTPCSWRRCRTRSRGTRGSQSATACVTSACPSC
jgi:hypothetical protein